MKVTKKLVVWILLILTVVVGGVAIYFAYQFSRPTVLPQTGAGCYVNQAACTADNHQNCSCHTDTNTCHDPNVTQVCVYDDSGSGGPVGDPGVCDADKGGGAVARYDTWKCPGGCGGDGQCTSADAGSIFLVGQNALGAGECGQVDKYNSSGNYCGIQALNCSGSCATTVTNTPHDTATNTPTRTPTNTPSRTPTNTPSNTPTGTRTPTPTPTNTSTSTPTATATGTQTPTPTGTTTATPLPATALISDEADRLILGSVFVLIGFWIYALDGHRILGNLLWNNIGGIFDANLKQQKQDQQFRNKLLEKTKKKQK